MVLLLEGIENVCLNYDKRLDLLNPLNRGFVIRQEPLGKTGGYRRLR